MNISKKALLVLVMGSLVSGCRIQAAETAASVILPLMATGAALKYSNSVGEAGYQNLAKAGAALSWAAWASWIKNANNSKKGLKQLKNHAVMIGLVLSTVVLANGKTALNAVKSLQPYGMDVLLSEPAGEFGFGTLTRNLIPYILAKKACEEIGLLDKE